MPTRSADVLRAAVAGLLLAFSFPRLGHPALAWIALTPLLAALCAGRLRHAFLLGLLTGGIYFTGTLYWITRVMAVYGDLPAWLAVVVRRLAARYPETFEMALTEFWDPYAYQRSLDVEAEDREQLFGAGE